VSPPLRQNADFLRLWWVGSGVFLVRWYEVLVFGIYTYQETNSPLTVALILMIRLVPLALFGALLGVIGERMVRHVGLMWTLIVSLATASVLTLIAWSGHLQIWHLAIAAFINGVAWAADNPIRRAMVGEVAGTERLSTAMALELGTSNATRLAGPGIGGLLLTKTGITGAIAFTAVVYLATIWPAARIQYRNTIPDGAGASLRKHFVNGFTALRREPKLIGTFWLTIVFNLFAWPVMSMLPVIGRDQLGLQEDGVGLLASMDGLGALIGAIVIIPFANAASRYGKFYSSGVILFLLMLPIFGLSTEAVIAGIAVFFVGFGQAWFAVMQSTITYSVAPPGMRSQAMGFLTMCIGASPIGLIFIGQLAQAVTAPHAAAISAGLGLFVVAISWKWWRAILS